MSESRRVRALVAVVLQMLMIQLAIVSGARRCPMSALEPSGVSHAASGGAAGMADRMTHDASGPSDQPRHQHHPDSHCDLACLPGACASATHCVSVAGITDEDAARLAITAAPAVSAPTHAPRSFGTAPDTPPPRA